ncbi:hypothetical protein EDB92DRAFT_309789 [Lactarius akahatsu]|uniref:Arrestin C-terminal-like domain-containing protein n=1 Tax=Lactarius akahatsu TaxID=416441 RepID=A0AAD4L4V7_9AGAM|nr:hypothetical protein EDB92DRAFT_309789 [Lactarius akahatsu]
MSQAKLTLRPPPNIDFVQGYPGIPPGAPDRPQAAVKGAIEVRMGPQGVKAKYVRVELRKIETLPGGAQNSFYDFVGQSPINLWQSSEEYSMLHSQDIPFYIRIPESIPPTLALESGAGIKYELVGQVCVQGKAGFFRRNKSIILSSSTPITIDKHELHSTWPVFQQHESRHLTQDAVMLTVDRSQNCYGPGDRVAVQATIRSDGLHTTILRGFEFTLKETTIFRAGPHVTSKSSSPQVKINIVGEQKVPVNVTMHGGQVHRSELAVMVPQTHTTTTLTSARHIDITYVLIVKALMGTGKPLIMELPVIVSNWPRYVSTEAVRRIGIAPSLSLQQPVLSMNTVTSVNRPRVAPTTTGQPATVTGMAHPFASVPANVNDSRLVNTMPNGVGAPVALDEMGFIARPSSEGDERQPQPQAEASSPPPRRRSRTGSAIPPSNRFTITNMTDNEFPEDSPHINAPGSTLTPQTQSSSKNQWPTAEEEKARLYQEAKAKVERVQGGLDRSESSADEYPSQGSPQSSIRSAPQVDTTRWATAEEEKIRLFTQAQNNARIVQGYAQDLNDSRASHGRGASRDSSRSFQQSGSGRPPVISAGAALYSHAMATANKPSWSASVSTSSPMQPPASQSSRLPTAAEEKEMLRRYHDATNAVQRHHEANFGPSDGVMSSGSTSQLHDASAGSYSGDHSYGSAPDELPPPWVPSAEFSQTEGLSEKERYRIAFEARERAARQQQQPASPPPPASPPVSPPADYYTATGTRPDVNGSDPGLMEAADDGQPPPWQPTPPTQSGLPPHLRARSQPVPPSSPGKPGSPRVLSAAEEKAMLKAKYEEEESKSLPPSPPPKGRSPSSPGKVFTPPTTQTQTPPQTPPPLMPRPPASYIQETAEEDARLQDELANAKSSISANGNGNGHATVTRSATGVGIATPNATLLARRASTGPGAMTLGNDALGPLRPSSPFTIGWDSISADGSGMNGFAVPSSPALSPPPLPPKVPLEH